MADVDEDPYAVSSDSDENSERLKKPPPKITIEGRSNTDFKQLVGPFLIIFLSF